MIKTRKTVSVKGEVHERLRKAAAKLSTSSRRMTIAELIEAFSVELPSFIKKIQAHDQ